jgi:hypothetical protein
MEKKEWNQGMDYIRKARLWPENLGVGKPYVTDERLEDYLESTCLARVGNQARSNAFLRNVLEKQGGGSYALLNVLALRQVGKRVEAEELLNREFAASRWGRAGEWCLSVFKGDNKSRAQLELDIETARGKGEWNPVPADPGFLLVYEMIRALGK